MIRERTSTTSDITRN